MPEETPLSEEKDPAQQAQPVEQFPTREGIAAPVPGAGVDRAAARIAARAAARAAAAAEQSSSAEVAPAASSEAAPGCEESAPASLSEALQADSAEQLSTSEIEQCSPQGQRTLQEQGSTSELARFDEQILHDQSTPLGQTALQHPAIAEVWHETREHEKISEDIEVSEVSEDLVSEVSGVEEHSSLKTVAHAPSQPAQPEAKPAEKPCRHEHVKIYQRKLKGLERRLVATKAWLPVGFKPTDFSHLSEGSYCFCSKCRARLFPRRTAAEKAAARLALAQGKADAAEAAEQEALLAAEAIDSEAAESGPELHVEELELESVDVQDIQAEGVKLSDDEESCSLTDDEDI